MFLSADINPFAQQVRKLYEFGIKAGQGVGCTTSVGFIPKEFDENARNTITKAELLEFSFVPVPANQGVGPAAGRALTFDEARALGIDMVGMRSKGMGFAEIAGFIPKELGEKVAEEKTAWKKPALKDFTDKSWTELSDTEKTAIAATLHTSRTHAAISKTQAALPPRHDGAIVLNGLKSAMKALADAVELPADRKAVYDHLAAIYKLFKRTPLNSRRSRKRRRATPVRWTTVLPASSPLTRKTPTARLCACRWIKTNRKGGRAGAENAHQGAERRHDRQVERSTRPSTTGT